VVKDRGDDSYVYKISYTVMYTCKMRK